ncbi:MAG: hypothetical protein WAO24_02915 [Peptococcia bacterium]
MEKFKQKLGHRIIMGGVYCLAVVALTIISKIYSLDDHATSFALGFGVGLLAVVIYYMNKYRRALKSEEKLQELYIEETDERQQYINAKIGGTGLNISILVIALAMLVANYFNLIVFFTLLATTMFLVIVKAVLLKYYSSKI